MFYQNLYKNTKQYYKTNNDDDFIKSSDDISIKTNYLIKNNTYIVLFPDLFSISKHKKYINKNKKTYYIEDNILPDKIRILSYKVKKSFKMILLITVEINNLCKKIFCNATKKFLWNIIIFHIKDTNYGFIIKKNNSIIYDYSIIINNDFSDKFIDTSIKNEIDIIISELQINKKNLFTIFLIPNDYFVTEYLYSNIPNIYYTSYKNINNKYFNNNYKNNNILLNDLIINIIQNKKYNNIFIPKYIYILKNKKLYNNIFKILVILNLLLNLLSSLYIDTMTKNSNYLQQSLSKKNTKYILLKNKYINKVKKDLYN